MSPSTLFDSKPLKLTNPQVVVLLQGKLADVGSNFKEVLEVRTKNLQASRSRTENFVSSVSAHTAPVTQQSASPLYSTPTKSRTPQPGYQNSNHDILNLDPSSALMQTGPQSDQQLLMMEEAQAPNSYINMRGNAIDMIEQTINELGGVFGQLAAMVSEQGEQIQRIDANTEDVVDNVQGAQRELMKYWGRVSGNRWLIAKMFGVLMVRFFPAHTLVEARANAVCDRYSSYCGYSLPVRSFYLSLPAVAYAYGRAFFVWHREMYPSSGVGLYHTRSSSRRLEGFQFYPF